MGAIEEQEEESKPIELEKRRKRGDLDQSQKHTRRGVFTPKTSKAAPERLIETAEKGTEGSSVFAHVPSSPLGSMVRSSSKIKHSVIPTSKNGDRVPVIEMPTEAFYLSFSQVESLPYYL